MYINKIKKYNYSLSELKQDLNIHQTDDSQNGSIDRYYKSAISHIEKRIAGDIVPTINQLEDYCFYGYCYQINEPNVLVTGVTITNNIDTIPIAYTITSTGFTIQKYNQYTLIKFKRSIQAEKININYSSGFNQVPVDLKRAIVMMTAQLFDIDRQGFISNALVETKTIDRLITPYINYIY